MLLVAVLCIAQAHTYLLRYHWKPGLSFTFTNEIQMTGTASERILDVTVQSVSPQGRAKLEVRTGCRNGVCTPHWDTIEIDRVGKTPRSNPSVDLPFIRLPDTAIPFGFSWQDHTVEADGRLKIESHFRFNSIERVEGHSYAVIDDSFRIQSDGVSRGHGRRTILLDMSDGLPFRCTLTNHATVPAGESPSHLVHATVRMSYQRS